MHYLLIREITCLGHQGRFPTMSTSVYDFGYEVVMIHQSTILHGS